MDYLTENAIFTCNQGGIIKCKDDSNDNVKYKGSTVLTTAATIKSRSGICATLTLAAQGVSQQCQCKLTNWIMPDVMKSSNSKNLLMQSSTNACQIGDLITVSSSGVDANLIKGVKPKVMSIPAAKIIDIKTEKSPKKFLNETEVKNTSGINDIKKVESTGKNQKVAVSDCALFED